jgi:hypothetical protein
MLRKEEMEILLGMPSDVRVQNLRAYPKVRKSGTNASPGPECPLAPLRVGPSRRGHPRDSVLIVSSRSDPALSRFGRAHDRDCLAPPPALHDPIRTDSNSLLTNAVTFTE